jgi:hypothetical protein
MIEHKRIGLYDIGPNGKPVLNAEGVAKAYATLNENKDIQYALAYTLDAELRAKTEEVMIKDKLPKAKAKEIAGQMILDKFGASSTEEIKNNYLKSYVEPQIKPQLASQEKIQGKGSNFNFFGPGGKGGVEFAYSDAGEIQYEGKTIVGPTVTLRKGNGKTIVSAEKLGISTYKGDVPFDVAAMTPTLIVGKSFKSFETDMSSKGYETEISAAGVYKSGYAKGTDGLYHALVGSEEMVYPIKATRANIELLGAAFVEAYKQQFKGKEGNVFERPSKKSTNKTATANSWDKYKRK